MTALPHEMPAASPEVKRYQQLKLIAHLCSLGLSMALLVMMALWFGPKLGRVLEDWIGSNDWLRLTMLSFLYAAGFEILALPLDFWSGFILEHRYHLSNQTLLGWVWRQVKGYLVGGPIGLVLLLGLYVLLKFTHPWWLWATLGWLAVTLLLGQLLPVVILPLFYKITRLDDTSLQQRLERVARGTGLDVEGVYRMHLSAETRKANAALAGLGRTRRVLLGDTLLDQFTPEEIEVIFAHEVGHHVYRHLVKFVAWSVVLSVVGFWLVDLVLRQAATGLGYRSFDDPAALPLVLLVLGLFGFLMAPAQNALSRFFERQCDRYALMRTGLVSAYRSAFLKLAQINKADPDPNPLKVWLFDDHPPIRERLEMAETVILP